MKQIFKFSLYGHWPFLTINLKFYLTIFLIYWGCAWSICPASFIIMREIVSELGWRPVSKDSPAGENMMADYKHLQTFRQFMDSKQAIQGQYGSVLHVSSSYIFRFWAWRWPWGRFLPAKEPKMQERKINSWTKFKGLLSFFSSPLTLFT